VIRDGLRAMQAGDRIVEQWLQSQVVPGYDAVKADPSRGVPIKKVRANLVKAHCLSSSGESLPVMPGA
jgi:hypothetical protein